MEMVNKMKRLKDSPLGSRIATVHNGSALFTGNAGGGASNIRQYLIENDYLEAIIQLPNNIFYNTGITTYIWILSNHKPKKRQGKVQLIDASQLYEKLRKNLGEKNCAFTPDHIAQITKAYLQFVDTGKEAVDGVKAQVFDNRDFGYWKITVDRPLRKSTQFTAERVESVRFDKRLREEMEWMVQQWGNKVYQADFLSAKARKAALDEWLEQEEIDRKTGDKKKLLDPKFWIGRRELVEAATQLHQEMGEATSHDFNHFQTQTKSALLKLRLNLAPAQLKAILEAVSWRDPEAAPVFANPKLGEAGGYEPDSELRDTENVPLNYEGGIDAYFKKEVLPHVEDAWIDESKTVIGYEISFNKYFYVHQPLRDLDEVVQEIRDLEAETEGLLEQILNFGN